MKKRDYRQRFEVSESRRLTWYAAMFDEETRITEPDQDGETITYTEVLRAGCFADTLKDRKANVTANIDHDDNQLFAQTFDGSLLLQEDARGLFCSCWLPPTELGDRIIRDVQSGKLDGASFRFAPTKDRKDGEVVERLAVQLHDVCLTSHPAYPGTAEDNVMVRTGPDRKLKQRSIFARLKLAKIRSK